MSNFFPSSRGPASHSHSSSMHFAPPAATQISSPPTEGTPAQAFANPTVSNIAPYTAPGPTLPPLQHRGESDSFRSSPQHGFTPQQSRPIFRHNTESHPPPPVANSAPDLRRVHDPFHSYDPAQKPEVRTHRSPPKRPAPADSPDGKAPSSNGRKRARTKVVAWDPKDLEDIYVRKEINKEDWDSIGKVSLSVALLYLTLSLPASGLPQPDTGGNATTSHRRLTSLITTTPISTTDVAPEIEGQEAAAIGWQRSRTQPNYPHC